MPKISLIIVNYNGGALLRNCLEGIKKQTFQDFEIIIVDNFSADDSREDIETFLRKVGISNKFKIIMLDRNTGFSQGNIQGLRVSKSSIIATLNNDTKPEEGWLEELLKALDKNPKVGICASKLVVYGTNSIDSAGDCFTQFLKGDKRGEGQHIGEFDKPDFVFGACAGAALYRREMIEKIGFLDEDFFLIHEDTDLNFRTQLAGWKVLYVPTAVVHHKVRSSIGNMSDLAMYYTLRNSEFVRVKNVPLGVFLRCLPEFLLGTVSEFFYFAVKHKKFKLYIRAKKDALKMFPHMWKKRKLIMKTRKVSNSYLLSLMTPIWQKDFFKAKLGKFLHG